MSLPFWDGAFDVILVVAGDNQAGLVHIHGCSKKTL